MESEQVVRGYGATVERTCCVPKQSWSIAGGRILMGATLIASRSPESTERAMHFSTDFW